MVASRRTDRSCIQAEVTLEIGTRIRLNWLLICLSILHVTNEIFIGCAVFFVIYRGACTGIDCRFYVKGFM
jgi:hypothetical protein